MTHLRARRPVPAAEAGACYVTRENTFAGTHGDERDAPKTVADRPVRVAAEEPRAGQQPMMDAAAKVQRV
jgi:hypothetical protein